MLIHPDPIDAKPIEERVRGLICRQLALRVAPNDIDVTYGCLVSIARSGDEPTGAFEMFDFEIAAYREYLNERADGTDNDRIYEIVLECLRADTNLLYFQMEETMAAYVQDLLPPGIDPFMSYESSGRIARAIRLVTECDSDNDILEMLDGDDMYESGITRELLVEVRNLQREVNVWQTAMSLYEQGAEIAEVVAMMKQFL